MTTLNILALQIHTLKYPSLRIQLIKELMRAAVKKYLDMKLSDNY